MKEEARERLLRMISFEQEYYNRGYKFVAGVDEAGRGPLAGDVYAAAVIFPQGESILGLDDSKRLSEKKREELFWQIKEKALSYSVGIATVEEIESFNILNATFLAMRRAIDSLTVKPDFVIVDGNQKIKGLEIQQESVVKGDSLSLSIAASSIIAKVSRDNYMKKIAEEYPQYEFSKHKGYGTALHKELIKKYGPSKVHRLSFLKNILK